MALNPKGDSAHELRLGNLCPPRERLDSVFMTKHVENTISPLP